MTKSGGQDEARGSDVIPKRISAQLDSFESSDERVLPVDLLSDPPFSPRIPVSGVCLCSIIIVFGVKLNQNLVCERDPSLSLKYFSLERPF